MRSGSRAFDCYITKQLWVGRRKPAASPGILRNARYPKSGGHERVVPARHRRKHRDKTKGEVFRTSPFDRSLPPGMCLSAGMLPEVSMKVDQKRIVWGKSVHLGGGPII